MTETEVPLRTKLGAPARGRTGPLSSGCFDDQVLFEPEKWPSKKNSTPQKQVDSQNHHSYCTDQ
ncbi:hypothetical protein RJJ37_10915 [Rhizobium redzepovicii]|uniref:Uncharacterized protein n=1 Tax=Rhizobium redzepovicii TaxID=2867518 RepID=A0AAW8P0R7_9HYPH|nr:hypothetical protein [Rhizobium redzepovicii]MDR9760141.1 hypothetical protein [Rhizobium redzepovicii]